MASTLTIGDLLAIDKGRIQRSKDLKVQLEDTYNILKEENILYRLLRFLGVRKGKMFYIVFKYKVLSISGSNYTVLIRVSPSFDEEKFLNNKVQVFCTCADFKYRVAYELNKRNNVYVVPITKEWLGEALVIPPTKVSTSNLCKHVYACIDNFRENLDKLIIK